MITGEFDSIRGNTYRVEIGCNYNYIIGSSDAIQFASDPINIIQDTEDTLEQIIKTQAEIRLLVKDYIGDYLFTSNDREISVKVYKNNVCIFDGYVQPNTYNQDFAKEYTELTLNCQDYLCTLENHKYKENTTYAYLNEHAVDITFKQLLVECLGNTRKVYYDNSIKRTDDRSIFDYNGISELLLLGDEEDDLWTNEEVLKEVLQYYNLHIIQFGNEFYVFNWDTLRSNSNSITWQLIIGSGSNKTTPKSLIQVNEDLYKSNDTQLSVSEVYNQIQVKCELTEKEDLFKSPLDKDSLITPFTNKQLYLTEYYSEDTEKINDWYFQFKQNKNWNLRYYDSNTNTVKDVNDLIQLDASGNPVKQYKIPETLHKFKLAPFIGEFGKDEKVYNQSDTNIKNKVDMKPYLVITCNGSENQNVDNTTQWNTISQALDNAGGMVEYKSNTTAGVLSPTDPSITNYIVFSGEIMFQPKVTHNSGKRVITNYYGKLYPNSELNHETPSASTLPYLSYDQFKDYYSEYYGDWLYYKEQSGVDSIDKVPVLICQLKIGDKYCVEVGENEFVWLTAAEASGYTITDDGGQQVTGVEPVFTLGINPVVGDYFLCKDWSISNTLRTGDNVDAEGTAIPIKSSDNLAGPVEFRIISPYYYNFSQQIRKHPTFFRHTKWWTTNLKLFEFVENMYIKDFECKLYSDNALVNNAEENDLVYMSAENVQATREPEEFTFKFNTALTSSEAIRKGITTTSKLSNVIDIYNSRLILSLKNTVLNETAKAEELFINDLYTEFSNPKLVISTTFDGDNTTFWKHYSFSYLANKNFYPISQSTNCKYDNITYKLKQI